MIRYLNKKEENRYHDRDDPDYYGIRDMESLFNDVYLKLLLRKMRNMKAAIGLVTNYTKVEETKTKLYLLNNILSR